MSEKANEIGLSSTASRTIGWVFGVLSLSVAGLAAFGGKGSYDVGVFVIFLLIAVICIPPSRSFIARGIAPIGYRYSPLWVVPLVLVAGFGGADLMGIKPPERLSRPASTIPLEDLRGQEGGQPGVSQSNLPTKTDAEWAAESERIRQSALPRLREIRERKLAMYANAQRACANLSAAGYRSRQCPPKIPMCSAADDLGEELPCSQVQY